MYSLPVTQQSPVSPLFLLSAMSTMSFIPCLSWLCCLLLPTLSPQMFHSQPWRLAPLIGMVVTGIEVTTTLTRQDCDSPLNSLQVLTPRWPHGRRWWHGTYSHSYSPASMMTRCCCVRTAVCPSPGQCWPSPTLPSTLSSGRERTTLSLSFSHNSGKQKWSTGYIRFSPKVCRWEICNTVLSNTALNTTVIM